MKDSLSRLQRSLPRPWKPALVGLLAAAIAGIVLLGACAVGGRRELSYEQRVQQMVRGYRFDVVHWELVAVPSELAGRVVLPSVEAEGPDARMVVLEYLAVARTISRLQRDCERIVAQGGGSAASSPEIAAIERKIAALEALQEPRRLEVERILESQVSAVLAEEGLGWLGSRLPPPAFDFTEPPAYLVLSPRDQINTRMGIYLNPGLPLSEREAIELALESTLPNTSALVAGTGGFSTWPAMLVDAAGLDWILSTVAHEWAHVYLTAYPVGRAYYDSSEMTAINETLASMIGDEVGELAMRRFYPELLPDEEPDAQDYSDGSEVPPPEGPEYLFDFGREMRITRERVDELLAQGRIEDAEAYMNERRLEFVANGYYIRRLNQAYFAFHGSYRTGPAAPADDPILPRLESLRAQSDSLAQFVATVRDISSFEDLLALVPAP